MDTTLAATSSVAALVLVVATLLAGSVQAQAPQMWSFETAEFRGLDKLTARIQDFSVSIGEPYRFGALEITVRACRKNPPVEPPRTFAFVEVREVDDKQGGVLPDPIFEGWMLAESPGLNALEHPVYDFWLTGCADFIEEPGSGELQAPAAP